MTALSETGNSNVNVHISAWKYAHASVIGTSHVNDKKAKQDFCLVEEKVINGVNYLFSAVADGAGSAKYSDVSSKYLCKLFIRKIKHWLIDNEINTLERDTILSWFIRFQNVIKRAAKIYKIDSIKEFATTFLFAVLSEKGNIFVQIGDGIIAKGNSDELKCIFLPQNGEYLNATFFATEKNISENFLFEYNSDVIERLVMHTDGIELISFNFALQKPHVGFFNPIFNQLIESHTIGFNQDVSDFIFGFLNCERVNNRTDDDKTLVVITSLKEFDRSI